MRKRSSFIIILLFFLLSIHHAFGHRLTYWEADLDGYGWRNYSRTFKIGYVTGYCHALWVASQRTMVELSSGNVLNECISYDGIRNFSKSMTKLLGPEGVSVERVVYEMDDIYQSPSNRSIPVHALIPLVGRQVRGEVSSRDLNRELQAFRAEYSRLRDSKPRGYAEPEEPQEEYSQPACTPKNRQEQIRREQAFVPPTPPPQSYVPYTHQLTGFSLETPDNWKIVEVSGKPYFLEIWSPQENFIDNYSEYIIVSYVNWKGRSVRELYDNRNYSGMSGREKHFREVRLFCQGIDNGLQEVHAVFARRG